jgi:hypothetical protein
MEDQDFIDLIRRLKDPVYQVDVMFRYVEKTLEGLAEDYGSLEMCPDFQRGHVWTPDQKRHFIENVFRGVIPESGLVIQFNCPQFHRGGVSPYSDLPTGVQCLDGLQRITAVQKFHAGVIKPFGLSVDQFRQSSTFNPDRMLFRLKFAIYDFQSKRDVLDHYLAINAGGTPHSKSEIDRVKAMRDALETGQPYQPSP